MAQINKSDSSRANCRPYLEVEHHDAVGEDAAEVEGVGEAERGHVRLAPPAFTTINYKQFTIN